MIRTLDIRDLIPDQWTAAFVYATDYSPNRHLAQPPLPPSTRHPQCQLSHSSPSSQPLLPLSPLTTPPKIRAKPIRKFLSIQKEECRDAYHNSAPPIKYAIVKEMSAKCHSRGPGTEGNPKTGACYGSTRTTLSKSPKRSPHDYSKV